MKYQKPSFAYFNLSAKKKKQYINEGIVSADRKRALKAIGIGLVPSMPIIGTAVATAGYAMPYDDVKVQTPQGIRFKNKPEMYYTEKGREISNSGKYLRVGGGALAGLAGLGLSQRLLLDAVYGRSTPLAGIVTTSGLVGAGLLANKIGKDKLKAKLKSVYKEEGI